MPHAATTTRPLRQVDGVAVTAGPTTSTVSVPITSVGTRRAWVKHVGQFGHPAGVGRFIFMATPNAAIWADVAVLVMIWSIAHPASPGAAVQIGQAGRICRQVGAVLSHPAAFSPSYRRQTGTSEASDDRYSDTSD
jgi:hypothetical protein